MTDTLDLKRRLPQEERRWDPKAARDEAAHDQYLAGRVSFSFDGSEIVYHGSAAIALAERARVARQPKPRRPFPGQHYQDPKKDLLEK